MKEKVKEKEKMSTEKEAKLKALQLTLDKLDKTYGKGTVMKMGDRAIVEVETISSGSLGIDLALELVVTQEEELLKYTAQNPLKDYIDTCYCRSSKAGGIAAFIDAEHAFDRNYAEKLGVDIENLIISQPDNGEQALEIAENLIRSGALLLLTLLPL
jgi:recombination protein RecA